MKKSEEKEKLEFTDKASPKYTTKELAIFIKEQKGLSWEDTCYFILRLTMVDVEIQKQLADNMIETKIPKALQLIVASTKELGWGFLLEKTEDEKHDDFNGLIIGHPEYLDKLSKKLNSEKC